MSDTIVAKNTEAKFKSHPEGQFIGRCVDTINLGEKVEEYPGTPPKLVSKCALVFRTGERNDETGEYIDIAREFSISMGDKSNLRKFLEQWRGKPYTEAQLDEGVPLHKLTGNWGLLSVSHKTSGAGRTYANIAACVGVPKQMQDNLPEFEEYHRAEYWEKRKQEYAEEVQKFRGGNGNGSYESANARKPFEDDDDLPF
jgi:hypothetical protein